MKRKYAKFLIENIEHDIASAYGMRDYDQYEVLADYFKHIVDADRLEIKKAESKITYDKLRDELGLD